MRIILGNMRKKLSNSNNNKIDTDNALISIKVISSPAVFSQFMGVLTQWKSVIEQNNESLQEFPVENAEKITPEEKVGWWKKRGEINQKMKFLLEKMDNLIGKEFLHNAGFADVETTESVQTQRSVDLFSDKQNQFRKKERSWEEDEDFENKYCFANHPNVGNEKDNLVEEESLLIREFSERISLNKKDPPVRSLSCSYEDMKVSELKHLLKEKGLTVSGKKNDLIQRLTEYNKKKLLQQSPLLRKSAFNMKATTHKIITSEIFTPSVEKKTDVDSSPKTTRPDRFMFLVLDELLLDFPFESMPSLEQISCSRFLSLTHICQLVNDVIHTNEKSTLVSSHHSLNNTSTRSVDDYQSVYPRNLSREKCWFAIDVMNNLKETQQQMRLFLKSSGCSEPGFGWTGSIGEMPDENEIRYEFSY
jgi:hypothetical protein